ncbi:hypothetical protein Taro_020426 [Colocasia esculenta]|uniref:Protein ENHANCED DISEASE RESISTANCE 2 C-terminal domain-containing protein n=1 Tax=Colocasia esculenta TaxID=4460 RepID=A0A843UW81_COLES|nr:hypothetical protein [Colocasia esculenta]
MSHRRRIPPETHPTGDAPHRVRHFFRSVFFFFSAKTASRSTGGTPTGCAGLTGYRWDSYRARAFISFRFSFSFLPKQQAGAPVGLPPDVRDPRGTGGTPTGRVHLFLSVFFFFPVRTTKQGHRWKSHRAHATPVGIPPGAQAPVGLPPGAHGPGRAPIGPMTTEILYKVFTTCHFHHVKLFFVVRGRQKLTRLFVFQSEAGKKLPFILVINLQVPAKPNYSLVLYYAAQRPVKKDSLLGRFANGSDIFRDARFKLIPSIVEGYWMVKRAVGTKACLLGKAVTCRYLRQDNFLEIDVDIGSSSVARSIINLVLGYVTSLVVDLAILIEAKEEKELPEYILGTVRLKRIKPDSALPF